MKVAIFGGSFDPPHLAHVQVVHYLLESKHYDEVWVIPSKQNPLKERGHEFSERFKMCQLAFAEFGKKVQIRDDEKKMSGFTIDLIRHLKKKFPEYLFSFIAGSDLRDQIAQWKESAALQQMIDFEFLPRPPQPGSPFLPLSSTEVRRQLAAGRDPRGLLPEKVAQYVEKGQLYGRED